MKENKIYMRTILLLLIFSLSQNLKAQDLTYPYPVNFLQLTIEQKSCKMAYMDVPSAKPNGKSIILFHGKNFNGFYWKDIIPFLNELGYRVIVPDQIGFGESDKPPLHYSFEQLAANNKNLLDYLKIDKVTIIAHSMGGMLAIRFSLMFPDKVDKLILENPIGLEDYKDFVPYTSTDTLYEHEKAATYESYKKYQQSYYPEWKPEYEIYVRMQEKALTQIDSAETFLANALTYRMIYEQPVIHDLKDLKVKTLLIIGTADRTIVGKDKLSADKAAKHGQYQNLGKEAHKKIKGSKLEELIGVGHIPHIQDQLAFINIVSQFLNN